jgi:hypothetical protein
MRPVRMRTGLGHAKFVLRSGFLCRVASITSNWGAVKRRRRTTPHTRASDDCTIRPCVSHLEKSQMIAHPVVRRRSSVVCPPAFDRYSHPWYHPAQFSEEVASTAEGRWRAPCRSERDATTRKASPRGFFASYTRRDR